MQDFPSFEYLLVSGRRDDFVAPAGAFTKTYDAGKRWRVYRRVDPQFETVR